MPGVWEVLTDEKIRARLQNSVIETVSSGFMTIVSGAITGGLKYITRVFAHAESDLSTNNAILYIAREDASGAATVVKTHRFTAGLSGLATNPPFEWTFGDLRQPVLDLAAEEYLRVRSSVSGMTSVSVDFFEYGGNKEAVGRVEDLRS